MFSAAVPVTAALHARPGPSGQGAKDDGITHTVGQEVDDGSRAGRGPGWAKVLRTLALGGDACA